VGAEPITPKKPFRLRREALCLPIIPEDALKVDGWRRSKPVENGFSNALDMR
jgi:hypothetical protein